MQVQEHLPDVPLHLYKSADRTIIFNEDDRNLKPIEYTLPLPPPIHTIDGYGLYPDDQIFKHVVIPQKLQQLNKKAITDAQKIAILEDNATLYEEEISFIQREWERRENGYFFFCNGKVTYISGPHYFTLNYWHINHDLYKLPVYTDADRELFLAIKMVDEADNILGGNLPKGRRFGATTMLHAWRYEATTRIARSHGAMQSMTDTSAQALHVDHTIYAWDKMVFFFRPIYDGDLRKTSEVKFFTPRAKMHPDYGMEALDSKISFGNSTEKYYDGQRITRGINDEIGKTKESNVYERMRIQRPCSKIGTRIVGKWWNISTVEEMEQEGGAQFKAICDESMYHDIDPTTGRTTSELINIFIPSWKKFEGINPKTGEPWIDKFGAPHPDTKDYIIAVGQNYLTRNNIDAWANWFRMFPCEWADCWRPAAKNSPFNIAIISKRIDEIESLANSPTVAVDFEWVHGKVGEEVMRIANADGRFITSYDFADKSFANRRIYDPQRRLWLPANTNKFIAGGDPYKFRDTKNARQSKASMVMKMKHDYTIDDPRNDRSKMLTDRFILTYCHRTSTPEEFCEDFMKACCYYGCEMFPELNVSKIWDEFTVNGFGGYLFYGETLDGVIDKTPGETTTEKVKEDIFMLWQKYVRYNGQREEHKEILSELKLINGPKDMKDFDIFTAGGYALLGEHKQNQLVRITNVNNDSESIEIEDIFNVATI